MQSSAISHPRARRSVWYENSNETNCEVGLRYESCFVFTKFEQDGGYDADILEKMQVYITKDWPKLEVKHAKLYLLNYYFEENHADCQKHQSLHDEMKVKVLRSEKNNVYKKYFTLENYNCCS